MFDKERISKLKKGVLIVNNARGAIMDTQAVVDACNSGHIAGITEFNEFQEWRNLLMIQNLKFIVRSIFLVDKLSFITRVT